MINKCLLLIMFCFGGFAAAQDFSADMVSLKPAREGIQGKIYVSGEKVRFEFPGEQAHEGILIWNTGDEKRVVLMPQQHMYMEFGEKIPGHAFAFWRPSDVDNACPEWRRLALQMKTEDKIGSCHKVGPDVVNGRGAVKYEGTSSDGKSAQVWLDAKLRAMIKVVDSNGGGMEMHNIQEGSQPASLFEIPSGYQKFDMGAMDRQRPQH
jgi:hypothetical protein